LLSTRQSVEVTLDEVVGEQPPSKALGPWGVVERSMDLAHGARVERGVDRRRR
jgi:hypothetical protein